NLANFSGGSTAQAWQISSATQSAISRIADVAVTNNSLSTSVPSQSITLFVIPGGGAVTKPAAPTGLAAVAGNGTVSLAWNASGGATSYKIFRGTAPGAESPTAIATVSSNSYTDSGLANGTAYYYVVAASNSAGTSGNSNEAFATPAGA